MQYTDLVQYLGFHKDNHEFCDFLKRALGNRPEFDELSRYYSFEEYRLELGFTSENTLKNLGHDLYGGALYFTHFVIYPETMSLLQGLPYGLNFGKGQRFHRAKLGQPDDARSVNFLGKLKIIDHYFKDPLKISLDYDADSRQLIQIMVDQLAPFIIDSSQPDYSGGAR